MSDLAPRTYRRQSAIDSYVYDLTQSETSELTRELLRTKSVASTDRFVCFEIEGFDPFANIARQIEREVFYESFGNDPVMLSAEYAPYEDSSLFFLAVDTQLGAPAGVLRMIRNSPAGLKTLVDLADSTRTPRAVPTDHVMRYHGIDDLNRCWDGATATVPRRYRRKLPPIQLEVMRVVAGALLREHVEHFVSILDAPVYKVVRNILGLPVGPLADTPPFTYMGGLNHQPVYAHVSTVVAVAAQRNRRVAQKIRACFPERSCPGSGVLSG